MKSNVTFVNLCTYNYYQTIALLVLFSMQLFRSTLLLNLIHSLNISNFSNNFYMHYPLLILFCLTKCLNLITLFFSNNSYIILFSVYIRGGNKLYSIQLTHRNVACCLSSLIVIGCQFPNV